MTTKNDGGAAFPSSRVGCEGMSLRDWFAGQALAGIAKKVDADRPWTARDAYKYADAMLAERGK